MKYIPCPARKILEFCTEHIVVKYVGLHIRAKLEFERPSLKLSVKLYITTQKLSHQNYNVIFWSIPFVNQEI